MSDMNLQSEKLHPIELMVYSVLSILFLIISSPIIYPFISDAKIGMSCNENYHFVCFLFDCILPIMFMGCFVGLLKVGKKVRGD